MGIWQKRGLEAEMTPGIDAGRAAPKVAMAPRA